MAINTTLANNQAGQLNSYAQQLRSAKTQLNTYKATISNNWSGQEVVILSKALTILLLKLTVSSRNLIPLALM